MCLLRHDHPDRPWPEPADNEVPDLLPRRRRAPSALQNKRGSTPSNALATASASHTPPWTASRSATERARRTSRPSPRIVGRLPPRRARTMRRMLSNCVPTNTCSHSTPGPLTLTHTGLSHSCGENCGFAAAWSSRREKQALKGRTATGEWPRPAPHSRRHGVRPPASDAQSQRTVPRPVGDRRRRRTASPGTS